MNMRFGIVAFCIMPSLVSGLDLERQSLPLNREWRVQRVTNLEEEPGKRWQEVGLPHTFHSRNYEASWYETSFKVPKVPAGGRWLLRFGGVKYHSEVFLNENKIGGHFGGYDAFCLDATEAIQPEKTNLLRVGCRDWTALFSPGERLEIPSEFHAARGTPKDRILAPIGGRFSDYGIWDDVRLEYLPSLRVDRLKIHCFVREKRLRVDVTLLNQSGKDQTFLVSGTLFNPKGEEVGVLPSKKLSLIHGAKQEVTLSKKVNLRFWSPDDPVLHTLEVRLEQDGQLMDALRERFGYRQLWCEKAQFYFNGVPVILRASSSWPMGFQTRDEIAHFWRQVKEANCFVFRTHTQPWRKIFYEVADEVGLLIIPEGAIWNDDCSYRIHDETFWENYRIHIESMVRNLGNHACVVMWSLENELYGECLNERNSFATEKLAELVRFAQEIAPTQPITLESDGDPLNSVDVIGIHYPHELPRAYAYPDTCTWMDQPIHRSHQYPNDEETQWLWKREKPLYIGEYLWCPDNTPAVGTVFFGDDSYKSPRLYHQRAKAEAWRFQTQAYRVYRVSGLCPWTMIEGGTMDVESNFLFKAQQEAMEPLAAFPVEWNTRFFARHRVTRHVRIFNDSFQKEDLKLKWAFLANGKPVKEDAVSLSLRPCQFQEVSFSFETPAVDRKSEALLQLDLLSGGHVCVSHEIPCSVWPRYTLPRDLKHVYLYDPQAATRKAIPDNILSIASLHPLPEDALALIIGENAFEREKTDLTVIGQTASPVLSLAKFVSHGGTLLVLAQETYPAGLFPTHLTSKASTFCFPTMSEHPLLSGLSDKALQLWAGQGEHGVTRKELARPSGGRSLIVSGGFNGLATTSLIEYPAGKGRILLCQVRLMEKEKIEPAAQRLLSNLLQDLSRDRTSTRSVTLLSAPTAARKVLHATGVSLSESPEKEDILFASQGLSPSQRNLAEKHLETGGLLYLHRPTTEDIEAFLPPGNTMTLAPASGSVRRVSETALAAHLLREDLYWLDLERSYHPLPPAGDMIESVLVSEQDLSAALVLPAKDLHAKGKIIELRGDKIICATAGVVEASVDLGEGGRRNVGGILGGTPAEGKWPLVEVRIDGVAWGTIYLVDGLFRPYGIPLDLPSGRHIVGLAFINDANTSTEDRNLHVQALVLGNVNEPEKMDVLTAPAALVSFPHKKGTVLVDCLRWDESPHAGIRGRRALASLLTGLEATFDVQGASVLEAETMEISPEREWNRITETELYLGTDGGAETEINVATAGLYFVDAVGYGTPGEDEYPILRLSVNGEAQSTVELASDSPASHLFGEVTLPQGRTQLRLDFINDLYLPGADRNAHIDRIEFRKIKEPEP